MAPLPTPQIVSLSQSLPLDSKIARNGRIRSAHASSSSALPPGLVLASSAVEEEDSESLRSGA